MNYQIVQDFVRAINEHNVDEICSLMANDHKIIDSYGNEVVGKESMRACWIGYFKLFPDYKIEISEIFSSEDAVAVFGFAGGAFEGRSDNKENYWHLPVSWRANTKDRKIQMWQVYADTKIPFDIINKYTENINF